MSQLLKPAGSRLVLCFVTTCITIAASAQQSPLELMGDAFLQPQTSTHGAGPIRALVVGISEYRELPKEAQLGYADDDAIAFYRFLISKTGASADTANVRLLLNEHAKAAEVYAGLYWLLDHSQRNDRVIIFFAGHGDVETRTVRQRGFLLAHDSPRAAYQVGGTIKVADVQDFLETLVSTNKANVLLITDACRAGKLAGGDEGQAQTTASLQEQWAGIIKILSSQPGEKSFESEAWGGGHGVFTYHLIDGLKGMADRNTDGMVSLSELNMYLGSEVPAATKEKQTPIVSGNLQMKVSTVDPVELALVKSKKELSGNNAPLLASRSIGINDTINEKSMAWYRNFRDALDTKKLVNPTGESALHYFRLMEAENKTNVSFVNDMRRALVSALESNAQTVINRYMVNDKGLQYAAVQQATIEMQTAVGLVPPSDIRYKTLKARQLFLENGFLYCICHGDESTKEEADYALGKLRASLQIEPEAAYVFNSMGNVYYTRRNYDSARFYFKKASQLASKWSYPINNLGTVSLARGKKKQAIKYYKSALTIDPDYANIYNNLGNLYSSETRKYRTAVEYYQKAAVLGPQSSATFYYNIGLTYLYSRKEAERKLAFEYFNKIEGLPGAGYNFMNASNSFSTLKDPKNAEVYRVKAIQSYHAEIAQTPGKADLYSELADIYGESAESSDMQLQFLHKARAVDPKDAGIDVKLGTYHKAKGNYDSAIYYSKKAIALGSDQTHSAYSVIATSFYEMGEATYDSAIYYANKSIDLTDGKDKGHGYYALATVHHKQGELELAIDELNKATAASFDDEADYYNLLARWYVEFGELGPGKSTALKAVKSANAQSAKWAVSNQLLARIASQQEKYSDALSYLEKASQYKSFDTSEIEKEADFEPLREMPRYKALLTKAKAGSRN